MNRRKKKPKQVDYIELIQQKVEQIDWKAMVRFIKDLWSLLPKLHQRALMILVPFLFILFVLPAPEVAPDSEQDRVSSESKQRVSVNINTTGLSQKRSDEQQSLKSEVWKEYTVEKGDTLAQVFRNNDLAMSDLNALVRVEGSDKPLSRIKAGQLVRFKLAEDGKLDILQLEKSSKSVMFFRLSDGAFGRSK